jgi:hypothetical protein
MSYLHLASRRLLYLAGLTLVFASTAGLAFGGPPTPSNHAPEIDPGSASSALTLLIGGTLLALSRIRNK